jgi:type 1 glutamine amidotransferase
MGNVMREWLVVGLSVLAGCGSSDRSPTAPSAAAAQARVLVVTHTTGFRHGSIPVAEQTLEALGRSSGAFTVRFCRTADDVRTYLSTAGLAEFDAVVFANTTGNLAIPDVRAFLDWVAAGHGFAGMHSAADTYHDEGAYLGMLGNEFLTHGAEAAIDAIVETPSHPASAPLGSRLAIFDEIYKFTRPNRGAVTMLLSLDRHPADGLPEQGQAADLPLAWAKMHGRGRVFYTALGHRDDVWQNPRYQQHVLGGLLWTLGLR